MLSALIDVRPVLACLTGQQKNIADYKLQYRTTSRGKYIDMYIQRTTKYSVLFLPSGHPGRDESDPPR